MHLSRLLGPLCLLIVPLTTVLLSNSGGPPAQRTGGFGEQTCNSAGCHSSFSLNAGRSLGGDFLIEGVPESYQLGQTYPLKVLISHPGQSRWGFELASRFAASGAQAGQLVSVDGLTQVVQSGGIQYIEQTSLGTQTGVPNGPVEFQLNWIAPDPPAGPVSFNAAGNAANGNGNNPGDYIYTAQAQSLGTNTVLVANLVSGNSDALNSRVYLWNPSATAGGVTVRVFTLPLSGGVAQELTTTPIDLGTLAARSALNVKVVEDILVPLGIPLPYTTDGGDLTLEFTVLAANIKGAAQVFSTSFASGTNPLHVIPSASAGSPTVLAANFMNGNSDAFNSRVYLWNPSASAGTVSVRVFSLPLSSGAAQELTGTPLGLGTLGAESAMNIDLANDILTPLSITTPYVTDGGNLTLEFTIQAADVVGAAQVSSDIFGFGVYPLQKIPSASAGSPTVMVANFMNGNSDAFNSRVYLFNPSASAGDVSVRVFTLPLGGGGQELTAMPLSLGSLAARSALNVKLVEDILVPLSITPPYVTDGGNLTLEFTIQAADVVGAAQVFSSSFAFGTNSPQVIPSTSAGSPTVLVANFLTGNSDALSARVYFWNPSASAGDVTVRVFSLPLKNGTAQELTTTPFSLGPLGAKSALNIKLVEDILLPLGTALPYVTDGGNLTLEFTIQAADVVGTAQVFSPSFAFGTYMIQDP